MADFLCALTFALLVIAGSSSGQAQSSVQEHLTKYTCTGDTVIFPWTVGRGRVGEIVGVQWGVVEGDSDRLIAIFSHGVFLPVPPFSSPRLSHLPAQPAGLVLADVTAADSGRYYMEMTGRHDGRLYSVRQETTLYVIDSILLSQTIQVHQGSVAVFNPVTSEWSVQLTCGHFLNTGHTAPFDVMWTAPDGRELPSTTYHNGSFELLLPHPVTPGTYTCRLPDHSTTCHHGLAPHLNGSVQVDGLVVRVALLEAQQGQLVQGNLRWRDNITQALTDNQSLKQKLHVVQSQQQSLAAEITKYNQLVEELQARHNDTTHTLTHLLQRVQHLEATTTTNNSNNNNNNNNNNINATWALHHSLAECSQQHQQLQQQNATLSHLHQQLLTNFTSLTQRVNDTAFRHAARLTSVRQRVERVRHRCSSLNSSVHSLENTLLHSHLDDSKVMQRVEDLERMVNGTRFTCCAAGQQAQGHLQGQADLDLRLKGVESQLNQLSSRQAKPDVSFHVRMNNGTDNVRPAPDTALVLSDVISNRGHAYDSMTGRFLAPYSATYMFVGSLAAKSKGLHAEMYLMWNEVRVDFVEAFGQTNYTSGAVHAVLHLQAGDRVWLQSHSSSYYNVSSTAFSGALLNMDP